jgi:MoxR-like ATPase
MDEIAQKVATEQIKLNQLRSEISKVLVGQKDLLDRLILGLLCGGHVLVEGLPGLAKTTAIKSLASCLNISFSRIQFTPDLLPADVVGTMMYNQLSSEFQVKKGPIFGNLILADEVNRSPAKVQSALLEVMQERQVTIGTQTFKLPSPFFVMATQNPIEQQGTYPLPEAQLDRFLFKLKVGYPSPKEELEIMNRSLEKEDAKCLPVWEPIELFRMQELMHLIYLDDKVKNYIVQLVHCTRAPKEFGLPHLQKFIEVGASPRASVNLAKAAKGTALMQGRSFVTPADVKQVAMDILRHRILISYEGQAEEVTPEKMITQILDQTDVP